MRLARMPGLKRRGAGWVRWKGPENNPLKGGFSATFSQVQRLIQVFFYDIWRATEVLRGPFTANIWQPMNQ